MSKWAPGRTAAGWTSISESSRAPQDQEESREAPNTARSVGRPKCDRL